MWILRENDVWSLQTYIESKICHFMETGDCKIRLSWLYLVCKVHMQQYKKDRLKSRNKHESDIIFCEIPSCCEVAVDIHHVTPSMKKRTHKKDGSDLIALCRKHHEEMHNQRTQKKVEFCLAIVQKILTRKISKLFTL